MKILSIPESSCGSSFELYDLEGDRGVLAWVFKSNALLPIELVRRGERPFELQAWKLEMMAQDKNDECAIAWLADVVEPHARGILAPRSSCLDLAQVAGHYPRSWSQCEEWLMARSAKRLAGALAQSCQVVQEPLLEGRVKSI